MGEAGGFTSTFIIEHLVIHDEGQRHADKVLGEAVTTVVFILNRAPTKALTSKTPFEAWYGRKPSVSFLRTFGCNGHVRKTKSILTKL